MNKQIVCPLCRKESKWEGNPYRPFCSERCKMIDLGFWAMGEYRIKGEKISNEELMGVSNDPDPSSEDN